MQRPTKGAAFLKKPKAAEGLSAKGSPRVVTDGADAKKGYKTISAPKQKISLPAKKHF